jgi:Fe-S cluster assembly ATP-binding protein
MKPLLKIEHLRASIDGKDIIIDLNLEIKENEIHVIMGPNGCGKSTLSKLLAGHPSYQVISGKVTFLGLDLFSLPPETRSHEGLFLAFQYPVEIPGLTTFDFLRIAYNEKQKYLNKEELGPLDFINISKKWVEELEMRNEFLMRNLNEGFSGGEKKRNEILQMVILDPKLIILDEIDSGLDIDALKVICENINSKLSPNSSLLVITHNPKILKYLKPTFIHIMKDGNIVKTGKNEIIDQLEEHGYQYFN